MLHHLGARALDGREHVLCCHLLCNYADCMQALHAHLVPISEPTLPVFDELRAHPQLESEQRRVTRPSASAAALLARGSGLVDAVAQSQPELEQLDQLVARLK